MTPLHLAVTGAALGAGLVAWRQHRPTALALLMIPLTDPIREAIAVFITRPERAHLLALVGGDEMRRAPFEGFVRGVYHVEQALFLACRFGVLWAAMEACGGARARPLAAIAWLGTAGVVAGLYPRLSGLAWAEWSLGWVYAFVHLGVALASGVAWGVWLRGRERPRARHRAVLILTVAELLMVGAGPYAGGPQGVWARWNLGRLIYLAAYLWIAVFFIGRGEEIEER